MSTRIVQESVKHLGFIPAPGQMPEVSDAEVYELLAEISKHRYDNLTEAWHAKQALCNFLGRRSIVATALPTLRQRLTDGAKSLK